MNAFQRCLDHDLGHNFVLAICIGLVKIIFDNILGKSVLLGPIS